MKLRHIVSFSAFGLSTILFRRKKPILGTIILTDRCNLTCRHCAVNNIRGTLYPLSQILSEMELLHRQGVRILFFCGGETFLWHDGEIGLRDLVRRAKKMGFSIVNVVTNGTFPLDLPEADLILLSLDGEKENHNLIRGDTFDAIMNNIRQATSGNICLYMAINQLNKTDVGKVCQIAEATKNIRAVSYNFHTPYPGTEALSLSAAEKRVILSEIADLIREGAPVFNLRSAFPYLAEGRYSTPCYQCVVMENGKQSVCGRCADIEGLCEQCGYFFAAEYSLLFHGNIKIGIDMLKTYTKYIT